MSISAHQRSSSISSRRKLLRRLLWVYFFLVIFEGALRKWIFPGLATPLLVIRDPVCIAAIFLGYPYLSRQRWLLGFVAVGLGSVPLAIVFGHGNLPVAIFGARIYLLHFPILFLFPAVFEREDVMQFGKVALLIAIPMTVLLGLQFSLPSSHFLNVGVGGEGTSIFGGALGHHRASGTFSFTNGLASFYSLTGALFVALLVCKRARQPMWIWAGAACLVLAVPLAISRTIAFSYALTGLFAIVTTGLSRCILRTLLPASLGLVLVLLVASRFAVFEDATEAFSARWEDATRVEGEGEGVSGVIENRVIDYGLLSSFRDFDDLPLFGYGIGMGSNVGAMFLAGERSFLLSEGSWGATLGELGPIFGILMIGLRIALTGKLGIAALKALRRHNPAPWILGSVALVGLFMGNVAQPTALGFVVVGSGLMLAALKRPKIAAE